MPSAQILFWVFFSSFLKFLPVSCLFSIIRKTVLIVSVKISKAALCYKIQNEEYIQVKEKEYFPEEQEK